MNRIILAISILAASDVAAMRQTAPLAPAPVKDSDLVLTIEPAGRMSNPTNAASPVSAGRNLLLIDQQTGSIHRWDGSSVQPLLSPATAPRELKLIPHEAIVNVAANDTGTALVVVFMSSAVPRGVQGRKSSRPGADGWDVFYRYDFDGAVLSNPKPFAALEVRSDSHTGGGLAMLADGSVLFATGDNGDAGEDGRTFAQDPASHVGKILRINPLDGKVTVVALGVRNIQRLAVGAREGEAWLDFIDMGGSVAEEFNSIRITDLLREGPPANFGWGRNKDGKAREGTFYVAEGGTAQGIASDGAAFRPPVAQFGREGASTFGASGTVSSDVSFRRIAALFGELAGGGVFAITQSRGVAGQDVLRVRLADGDQKPVTLMQLAGGKRPDPRFFTFPDGSAGVLIEQTGEFFKLTEPRSDATASTVARDGFVDSGGVRIHYVEQGRGPAVVLVHELDGGIRTWMSSGVFQALARDYHVIAIDARGHGLSDKPHDPARYGQEMATDIVRVLDRLSIPRAHVVGYSMGAEILTMLLVSESSRVVTATLVAGAGRFRWKSTDEQHMGEEALEFAKFGVSPKLYLEQTPEGTPDPTDAELHALALTALADPGRDLEALAAFSRARRSRVMTPEAVGAIRTPTLGIAGSTDPDLDELKALKLLRPDITVTAIDGATHAGPGNILLNPGFVTAVQAFLRAHPDR